MEKEEESKKRLNELEINHDNMSAALFVNKFGMKGVIATDKNSTTVLFCYPTGTTERRIKALNEALEKKGLLGEIKFAYPITIDSLQKDRNEINNTLNTCFNDYERNQLFNVD